MKRKLILPLMLAVCLMTGGCYGTSTLPADVPVGTEESVEETEEEPQESDAGDVQNPAETSNPDENNLEESEIAKEVAPEDESATEETAEETPREEALSAPVMVDETTYTGYATTALNVRSGNSTAYNIIGGLSYSQSIEVTGTCNNGWVRVNYNGAEAYCSGKYITDTKPEPVAVSTENAENVQNDTDAVTTSGICGTTAGGTAEWASKVNKKLALIPSNILNAFTSRGWTIAVTGQNIAGTYFPGVYNSVQGVTFYDSKTILIECREVAVNDSPIHEVGHALDNMCGDPSLGSEFAGIYNEEVETFKSRITNSSCVRNVQEFFAETFYYACINPSKCTPKALEFVQRYMNAV